MKPDFTKFPFSSDLSECLEESSEKSDELKYNQEGIPIKQLFEKNDIENFEHLDYAAGLPPYLRGPYATMYAVRPWTIRQYAGFSTAEESNAFYRRNLAGGQKGIIRCF